VEVARPHPRVLILGALALVRDNVRVLLKTMGYHYVTASTLKEALVLLDREKPDAAILDPQQAGSSPTTIVAAFHRTVPSLRGRAIVLTGEEREPELLKLLDAYSLPPIPVDLLLQQLWPCLDSLLRRNVLPRQVTDRVQLIIDSFLQPSPTGVRYSQTSGRRLLYKSGSITADLSIERRGDSESITLVGQIMDSAQPERETQGVPVVLQGLAGLIGLTASSEFGEFHFDFDSQPGVAVEIGIGERHWMLIELPDTKGPSERLRQSQTFRRQPESPRHMKDLVSKERIDDKS